jgi:hypothetical protein
MAAANRFTELLECVARRLGVLDPWDRRIVDYWYVCGRQLTRNAQEVDRSFSTAEWAAHVSNLWRDFLARHQQFQENFAADRLSDEEINIFIEMSLVIRDVAQLTGSKESVGPAPEEVAQASILDLLDIFYQWDNVRRLQAWLATNAGIISMQELTKKQQEILAAIESCLQD